MERKGENGKEMNDSEGKVEATSRKGKREVGKRSKRNLAKSLDVK